MKLDQNQLDVLDSPPLLRDTLARAATFADWAHAGQTRSDGTPYIEHPRRVARYLRAAGVEDEGILAVAFLHDTIEDCDVTEVEIRELFGDRVARGVMQLTNKIEGDAHERQFGKISFVKKHGSLLEHCRNMDMEFKWVKLADRYDNLADAKGIWKPKRLKRYAKAGYELVKALMPWPKGSEMLACDLVSEIYEIIPPEEIEAYQIVDDVRE